MVAQVRKLLDKKDIWTPQLRKVSIEDWQRALWDDVYETAHAELHEAAAAARVEFGGRCCLRKWWD